MRPPALYSAEGLLRMPEVGNHYPGTSLSGTLVPPTSQYPSTQNRGPVYQAQKFIVDNLCPTLLPCLK